MRGLMNKRAPISALTPGPLGESLHPHRLQHVVGDAKLGSRIDTAALSSQPFAVKQVSPGEFCADAGIAKKLNRLEIKTFGGVTVTEQRA